MKSWRRITMGVVAAGAMMTVPAISFAKQGQHKEREATFVKLLRDSAGALRTSHPELAAGLTQFADDEAKEVHAGNEGKAPKTEVEGKAEQEIQSRQAAHVKLLRDAAAALHASRPELSADLTKAADRTAKKLKAAQKEDAKETEKNE